MLSKRPSEGSNKARYRPSVSLLGRGRVSKCGYSKRQAQQACDQDDQGRSFPITHPRRPPIRSSH